MKGFLLLMLLTASSITICAETTKPKSHKADSSHNKVTYSCTMHPEIISDRPGKCSRCGMTLIGKKPKAAGDDHNH